ncbi:MAG: glycoside hydrolase family 88 protein [Calditrichaeota bacterium]|nr:MAG: glycoside hydrolase family 88 protein [Calditrichota bacterium]MBL1204749.1 glycoside hydrolase family 88 protein [Calditrichota bacterium]NOG44577.1 glycoside hydrolase family 88 protein [Calditrichota bacterium]
MTLNYKIKSKLILSFSILIGIISCSEEKAKATSNQSVKNEIPVHIKMADSEMNRRADFLDYGKSDPNAKWNYQTGLFLKSLIDVWAETKEPKYFDYTKRVIDSFLEEDGTIKAYNMEDFNIDKINSGKVLLSLYKATNDEVYKKAADILREQLEKHPRTKAGGFWHKKRYPWQMWLDGIYMGSPFYAEYSQIFNQAQGFDDVVNQILLIDVRTRDPKTKLRYHAWDESNKQEWANPETGCSPNFWGRAMGWYAMALVDVLDYLPTNHPKREKVLFILNDLYAAIVKYQDKQTGLWYQVVDMPDEKGNYLEASASSMFVYAIAKAVNNNLIDSSFAAIAEKGYAGILDHLIKTDKNDQVNLTQVCSVAGLGGDPYRDGSFEYYINEPIAVNDLKGVGPFIMAGLQIAKLKPGH